MIDLSQLHIALDSQRNGALVQIRPVLQGPPPLTLRYRLQVRQNSAVGTSNIEQDGELQTGPSASMVQLSLPPGAVCVAHLEVFDGDRPVKVLEQGC